MSTKFFFGHGKQSQVFCKFLTWKSAQKSSRNGRWNRGESILRIFQTQNVESYGFFKYFKRQYTYSVSGSSTHVPAMLFDASMMWLWTSWRPGSTDMPFRFTSLNLIFEFFQNFASHFKGINRCWLGQFHTSTSAPSSRWPPRCRPRRRSCRTRPPSPASET